MRINWEEQDEKVGNGFTVYPDGMYTVSIQGAERVRSSGGTPQVKWSAVIKGGKFDGKRITEFTPLTEKGMWRTAKMVKAILLDIKSLGVMEIDSAAFDNVLNKCRNRTVSWLVGTRSYDGRTLNDIMDYLPYTQQEADDAPPIVDLDDIPEFLRE